VVSEAEFGRAGTATAYTCRIIAPKCIIGMHVAWHSTPVSDTVWRQRSCVIVPKAASTSAKLKAVKSDSAARDRHASRSASCPMRCTGIVA